MNTSQALGLWGEYGGATLIFVAWVFGGLIIDQLIVAFIRGRAKEARGGSLRAFADAFHGLIAWIAAVIGFWIAYLRTPLTAELNADVGKILKVVSVLIVTAFVARIAGHLIKAYGEREHTRLPSSTIFVNMTRALVWIIGTGVLLGFMGISLTPIIATFGVGGIVVGLALQPTLDNLFNGIQILATRVIVPGDFIKISTGEDGFVEDVTWRTTTIRRNTGETVIVPNGILGSTPIINYSRSNYAYILVVANNAPAGSDFNKIAEIALRVGQRLIDEHPGTYKVGAPHVNFTGTGLEGITFTTSLPIMSVTDQYVIKSLYVKELNEAFIEAGIKRCAD